jgi:hypothetical protein
MLELILLCSGEKFMYKQNIIAKGKNLHINNSLCEERIRVSNDFTGKKRSVNQALMDKEFEQWRKTMLMQRKQIEQD